MKYLSETTFKYFEIPNKDLSTFSTNISLVTSQAKTLISLLGILSIFITSDKLSLLNSSL